MASEHTRSWYAAAHAAAPVQSCFAESAFDYARAIPYENLPPAAQAVAYRALDEEGQAQDVTAYRYLFASVPPCLLPRSAWERPWERLPGICDADLLQVHAQVEALAGAIAAGGFRGDSPVLLTAHPAARRCANVGIDGGHHRLQAVRDLVSRGRLPAGYTVPVLVRFATWDWEEHGSPEQGQKPAWSWY